MPSLFSLPHYPSAFITLQNSFHVHILTVQSKQIFDLVNKLAADVQLVYMIVCFDVGPACETWSRNMLHTEVQGIMLACGTYNLCDSEVHGEFDMSMQQSVELNCTGTLRSRSCGVF